MNSKTFVVDKEGPSVRNHLWVSGTILIPWSCEAHSFFGLDYVAFYGTDWNRDMGSSL